MAQSVSKALARERTDVGLLAMEDRLELQIILSARRLQARSHGLQRFRKLALMLIYRREGEISIGIVWIFGNMPLQLKGVGGDPTLNHAKVANMRFGRLLSASRELFAGWGSQAPSVIDLSQAVMSQTVARFLFGQRAEIFFRLDR